MSEQSSDQYKQKVEELGQVLLDVIASVALGDFDVSVDMPEDIEVFADLGVGLGFMIDDLRELSKDQDRARVELEQKISQRTRELEDTLSSLQNTQRQLVNEGWEDFYNIQKNSTQGLILENGESHINPDVLLPGMATAIEQQKTELTVNGHNKQTLSLPIQLQDQVIGVIGFDRPEDSPWTGREIATVEAIVEQLGLALENQRLFDQTQSALSESDTLYQASAELNLAQTYPDILKVIQKYSTLGQSAHTLIAIYFDTPWTNNQTPKWEHVLGTISSKGVSLEDSIPFNTSHKMLLNPEKPTFIQNVNQDSRLDDSLRDYYLNTYQANSTAFLPLVVGGSWVGYLNLLFSDQVVFNDEDIRRAAALATQISVAIQNLRSVDLADQRAVEANLRSTELALVNRVISTVTSSTDLDQGLATVAKDLSAAIQVDEVAIALMNDTGSFMDIVADAANSQGVESSVGDSIPVRGNLSIAQAINTRKTVLVTQAQTNPQTVMIHDSLIARNYNTLYIIPMITGTDVIGTVILALYEEDARLTDEEISLTETIVLQASTAIQNSRLFVQTQAALTETANLYQASAELNTVQSFEDILSVMRRYSVLGEESQYVSINLFNTPWDHKETPERINSVEHWLQPGMAPIEEFPAQLSDWEKLDELMKIDQLTIIEDIASDSRTEGTVRDFFNGSLNGISLLTAPLVSSGQWIGQIIATFDAPIKISEGDTRRVLALAGQASVAIQNIRLLDETARRASQLETAATIAREASSSLDIDTLLNTAVNLIRDRFGFYHASIFLKEGNFSVVAASTGEAGRQLVENKHSLPLTEGKSIIGTVMFTGEPLIVSDVTQDPTHRPHPLLPDTRAEMGIPLVIGNRVIGALDVQSTRANAFSDDDILVLRTLADQIAVALDNARSFGSAQDAVEEMREIDRIKSEFLANMSHELRTPLNSIIGFSRVILKGIDGPINDIQKQDLEAIHNSGQHLLDMINNILDLSKIEANKMEISIEEIQLKDILNSVISTARGLVKEKDLMLLDNTGDNLPSVLADHTRVRQILLNLLQNATKFTDEGEVTVNFDIVKHPESGAPMAQISVTDTGIGISEEGQEKLFERFSQVDSSLTRKVGGSGLGLSISQHLVEMQGGKIWLESVEGKGSTFYFTLPIAAVKQPKEAIEEVISGNKIIVSIDDDIKVIDLYKRYLHSHGYQVVAITNPSDALNQIKQIKPHAITVDIMMPSRDGWQVISDIKSDPDTQNIPIIICSIVDDQDKGYNLGASDYLVKPILEEEFVSTIKNLDLNQAQDQHNILIIDDDPNILQLVEKAGRNDPSLIFSFADGGIKGLNAIKETKPDAVILDLMMPDMDGFSLLETINSDPILKDIPVIILTGADLAEEDRERISQYKQELLQKDKLKEDDLLECLNRALEKIERG